MSLKIPFHERARTFNKMFGLPHPSTPTVGDRAELSARLHKVKKMLREELDEIDEIIRVCGAGQEGETSDLVILTALSDWLGDIQVYAATEMVRHGLPIELVLDCIMDSQTSKLAPDGSPIVEDGKVVKGPNYRPPEPDISFVLDALMGTGITRDLGDS